MKNKAALNLFSSESQMKIPPHELPPTMKVITDSPSPATTPRTSSNQKHSALIACVVWIASFFAFCIILFMISQLIRKLYIKIFGSNAAQESPGGPALDMSPTYRQVEPEGQTVSTRVRSLTNSFQKYLIM